MNYYIVDYLFVLISLVLISESLRLSSCFVVTRKAGRTQHIITLFSMIYTSKRCKAKSAKGNPHRINVRRTTECKFPSAFSCEVSQMYLIPPASNCDSMCEMSNRGDQWRQCPGFILGACHMGTLSLVGTKIQIPRRKAGVQHKSRYLASLGTVSVSSHLGKINDQCRKHFTVYSLSY